jgi:hypothetical protein
MSTSNKVLEQELTKFAIKNPTVSSEKIATLRAAYAQEKLPQVFMEAKRKLLEDAARAANYDYKIKECFVFPHPFQRFEFFLRSYWLARKSDYPTWWRPLEDDGDALRLAVKLKVFLCHQYLFHKLYEEEVANGLDEPAATRRAIVRAAATLGKEAHESDR